MLYQRGCMKDFVKELFSRAEIETALINGGAEPSWVEALTAEMYSPTWEEENHTYSEGFINALASLSPDAARRAELLKRPFPPHPSEY